MGLDWKSLAVGAACGGMVAIFWRQAMSRRVPARGSPRQAAPVNSSRVLAKGKVAVIIGSGSGIGRAAALRYVSYGMKVMLADIDTADAASVRDECIAAGAGEADVLVQQCDCRLEADVRAAQVAAFKAFGKVHLLMNNAAIQSNNRCGPYEHADRWRTILETNLWGVFLGGLAFVPHMIEQAEPAVVVNTGSKQGITVCRSM
jgi:NAD(P)-dependent dehydrogenase (short-subunit alcohol dehydrogenase family)